MAFICNVVYKVHTSQLIIIMSVFLRFVTASVLQDIPNGLHFALKTTENAERSDAHEVFDSC